MDVSTRDDKLTVDTLVLYRHYLFKLSKVLKEWQLSAQPIMIAYQHVWPL